VRALLLQLLLPLPVLFLVSASICMGNLIEDAGAQ